MQDWTARTCTTTRPPSLRNDNAHPWRAHHACTHTLGRTRRRLSRHARARGREAPFCSRRPPRDDAAEARRRADPLCLAEGASRSPRTATPVLGRLSAAHVHVIKVRSRTELCLGVSGRSCKAWFEKRFW